jgi:hypothetical protein
MVCRILIFSCDKPEYTKRIKQQIEKDLLCLSIDTDIESEKEQVNTFRKNLTTDLELPFIVSAAMNCWDLCKKQKDGFGEQCDPMKFKVNFVLVEREANTRSHYYCHFNFIFRMVM